MRTIKLMMLCMIFFLTTNKVNATDEAIQYIDDGIVQYFCDAKSSSFYFDADSLTSPLIGFSKQKVDVMSLLLSSKEDSYGNITRLGSKKFVRQCGAIQLVFESGFYNSNIQGFLGLMDYPLLSISINDKKIMSKSTLNLCASGGVRMTCPTDVSIQSIKIIKVSRNLFQITLTEAFPEEDGGGFKLKNAIQILEVQ
ncbi:hypothetical protein EC844_13436 [Acinetobacter calcoaceticus]|uniref:Uncharacterized protein n=1 Tax=Acinetobacter calcoaceticus TaxID=471 RepID=A0A4R1XFQ1_ACICA|nr:hypothetical protein EC844_13436 [Acinetobacter calcoaceticus]